MRKVNLEGGNNASEETESPHLISEPVILTPGMGIEGHVEVNRPQLLAGHSKVLSQHGHTHVSELTPRHDRLARLLHERLKPTLHLLSHLRQFRRHVSEPGELLVVPRKSPVHPDGLFQGISQGVDELHCLDVWMASR